MWFYARVRWAVMAERKGLRQWKESIFFLQATNREAAFQRALQLGKRGQPKVCWIWQKLVEIGLLAPPPGLFERPDLLVHLLPFLGRQILQPNHGCLNDRGQRFRRVQGTFSPAAVVSAAIPAGQSAPYTSTRR